MTLVLEIEFIHCNQLILTNDKWMHYFLLAQWIGLDWSFLLFYCSYTSQPHFMFLCYCRLVYNRIQKSSQGPQKNPLAGRIWPLDLSLTPMLYKRSQKMLQAIIKDTNILLFNTETPNPIQNLIWTWTTIMPE